MGNKNTTTSKNIIRDDFKFKTVEEVKIYIESLINKNVSTIILEYIYDGLDYYNVNRKIDQIFSDVGEATNKQLGLAVEQLCKIDIYRNTISQMINTFQKSDYKPKKCFGAAEKLTEILKLLESVKKNYKIEYDVCNVVIDTNEMYEKSESIITNRQSITDLTKEKYDGIKKFIIERGIGYIVCIIMFPTKKDIVKDEMTRTNIKLFLTKCLQIMGTDDSSICQTIGDYCVFGVYFTKNDFDGKDGNFEYLMEMNK